MAESQPSFMQNAYGASGVAAGVGRGNYDQDIRVGENNRYWNNPRSNLGAVLNDSSGAFSRFDQSQSHVKSTKTLSKLNYLIVCFLREQPDHKPVTVATISQAIKEDIEKVPGLLEQLAANPKINAKNGYYSYRSKFNITNKTTLLKVLKQYRHGFKKTVVGSTGSGRSVYSALNAAAAEAAGLNAVDNDDTKTYGLVYKDIMDSYSGITSDVPDLIHSCGVIAAKIYEGGKDGHVLFHRDSPPYLIRLTGTFSVTNGDTVVDTTNDVTLELRRGDAILLGGKCYRVCSRTDVTSDAVARRYAPSASSLGERPKRESAEYISEYHGKTNVALPGYRYGVSNDLRRLWLETATEPLLSYGSRRKLETDLMSKKLTSIDVRSDGDQRKRPSIRLVGKGKGARKKARVLKKMTNRHLAETDVGKMLMYGGK